MWTVMISPYNDSATTTSNFIVPLYVGGLNNNGSTTITVFQTPNLHNLWGDVWYDIYAYMRVIIYFFTFVYFFKWFVQTPDSDIPHKK